MEGTKIKICGLKFPDNIIQITALQPDYIGFIFYPLSSRYVGDSLSKSSVAAIPKSIKKIGVFVNETIESIEQKIVDYELDGLQFHGDENLEFLQYFKSKNILIIKSVSIDNEQSFQDLNRYENYVDYLLLDTATPHYGGSGNLFNWELLKLYTVNIPFFLSGGIGMEQIKIIKLLHHPQLVGIDCNSRLELSPGLKNVTLTKQLIDEIRIK